MRVTGGDDPPAALFADVSGSGIVRDARGGAAAEIAPFPRLGNVGIPPARRGFVVSGCGHWSGSGQVCDLIDGEFVGRDDGNRFARHDGHRRLLREGGLRGRIEGGVRVRDLVPSIVRSGSVPGNLKPFGTESSCALHLLRSRDALCA